MTLKPYKNAVVILGATALFSVLLAQQAQAQLLPLSPGGPADTGISILAPVTAPPGGYASHPGEYLTVLWTVSEPTLGNYVYTYAVYNPVGDYLENSDGTLTSSPESVDAFQVSFNSSQIGALVTGSPSGGAFALNQPGAGVYWYFGIPSPVTWGQTSPTLSFSSDLAPILGNGQASDSSPPSPWSSTSPSGQTVPIPDAPLTGVPEPSVAGLLGLSGMILLPLRARIARILGRK